MPQYRNPFEKGDLYIKFDVQFPENNWISPEKLTVSMQSSLVNNSLLRRVCENPKLFTHNLSLSLSLRAIKS